MIKKKFYNVNFVLNSVIFFIKKIKTFKKKLKYLFFLYKSLKDILKDYDIKFKNIETILLFTLSTLKFKIIISILRNI